MFFDEEQVKNLKNVFNAQNRKDAPISATNPEEIWQEIQQRMRRQCDRGTAECIIASMMSRPSAPASWKTNPDEWLSSDDIDALEKQYCRMFKNYYYMGTVPIDFDKKSKSTGPGKHWIALFCDIRPELDFPRITFFDSYGHSPEKEIGNLMNRWKEQWDATGTHSKPMVKSYSKTKHQQQDSECGMYSLYFHFCCLLGIPMDKRIPDEVVRGFRGLLFKVK